jgi:hypothetical protein
MSTLSFAQLEQLWIGNGGSPTWAPVAAAVALAESGGNTEAVNPSDPYGGSFGLWQINGSHGPQGEATPAWSAQMFDPNTNAKQAVALSQNGRNWGPWKGDPVAAVQVGSSTPLPTQTLYSLLAKSGRSTGGLTASGGGAAAPIVLNTTADQAAGKPIPGACDDAVYLVNAGPFHLISQCQARALMGGALVAVGGLGMLVAVAIFVAAGFGRSGAAATAAQAIPGPAGAAVKAAKRRSGSRASSSSSRSSTGASSSSSSSRTPAPSRKQQRQADADRQELEDRRAEDARRRQSQADAARERREGFGGAERQGAGTRGHGGRPARRAA